MVYAVHFGCYTMGSDDEIYHCTVEAVNKRDAVRKAMGCFRDWNALGDVESDDFDFIKVIES